VGNSSTGDSNAAILATAGMTRTLVANVTARALGSGESNFPIFLTGSGTVITLQQVIALAENGSVNNFSLTNHGGATVVLRGGSFTARGGDDAWAIFNLGSYMKAENVTALGENSSGLNVGLYNNNGSVAELHGGTFTGRGGNQTGGVGNQLNSTLTAYGVIALAENGSGIVGNYAMGNYDNSTATVHGGVFIARGGVNNYALSNELNVTMKAENVTALAENGSSANHGMWNANNAQATVRGGSFTGRGGTNAYGAYNSGTGTTLDADSVTALGENGSSNYGLYNNDSAAAMADSSQFTGSSNGLYQNSGTVHLGVSQLDEGATRTSGTLICFQVYDGSYVAYTCP
jgi:hypothetical protein